MWKIWILFSLISQLCWTDPCTVHQRTMSCNNINQIELYDQLFKNKDQIDYVEVTIAILDSNFSTIEYFANPYWSKDKQITDLTISNSFVTNISALAFQEIAQDLYNLDLSQNNIEDVTFAAICTRLSSLNLSGNKIKTIDLSVVTASTLILNSNFINSITRSVKNIRTSYDLLNLGYNDLIEFDEDDLNIYSKILDLSYNSLREIHLKSDSSRILQLIGNNLKSLIRVSTIFYSREIYLSSMPNVTISVDTFVMSGSTVPVLNKNTVNIAMIQSSKINFSNLAIEDIEPSYFLNKPLSILSIDGSSLQNINASYFEGACISGVLNISHSQVKTIEKGAFKSLAKCGSLGLLDLSHNLLQATENVCGSVRNIDLSYNNFSNVDLNTFINCTDMISLNLSHSMIRSLKSGSFRATDKLEILDLRNNKINTINAGIFNFSRINTLYLQNNEIEILQSQAFSNMYNIILINLANNSIQSIEEESFTHLPKIDVIDLSNNKITILNNNAFLNLGVQQLYFAGNEIKYIKTKALSGLNNLKVVNFSNMGITYMEETPFYNLSKIEKIDLSKNMLSSLESYTFESIPVNTILLNENLIKVIEPFVFSDLTSLRLINLTYNHFKQIHEDTFYFVNSDRVDMEYTNISEHFTIKLNTKINDVKLTYNGEISKHFINNFYLKKLRICNSNITKISANSFKGLYGLIEMHFSNSKIDIIERGALNSLYNLEYLDVQNLFKNISIIPQNLFDDLKNLKMLNFSGLGISNIENSSFVGLKKLKNLVFRNNNLTKIYKETLLGLEESLESLDLSLNNISYIESATFDSLVNLQFLDLSNNSLSNVPDIISIHLKSFYISGNILKSLLTNSVFQLPALEILHLQDNNIWEIENLFFKSLSNLIELRVDNNSLSGLKPGVFRGLDNLQRLNISLNSRLFNNQNFMDYAVRDLPTLRYLNLVRTSWTRNNVERNSIYTDLPSLSSIRIDNNEFNCQELFELLLLFKSQRIEYDSDYPNYSEPNIAGISCLEN